MSPNEEETKWLAVIGKSLAFLSLSQAEMRDKSLVVQAAFLGGLGLSIHDSANMLGTTADSLGVMNRRAKKNKRRGTKLAKSK